MLWVNFFHFAFSRCVGDLFYDLSFTCVYRPYWIPFSIHSWESTVHPKLQGVGLQFLLCLFLGFVKNFLVSLNLYRVCEILKNEEKSSTRNWNKSIGTCHTRQPSRFMRDSHNLKSSKRWIPISWSGLQNYSEIPIF
jgi:hypothetical protein